VGAAGFFIGVGATTGDTSLEVQTALHPIKKISGRGDHTRVNIANARQKPSSHWAKQT